MTPNDKLPEEMQEEIKQNAEDFANSHVNGRAQRDNWEIFFNAYEAGATAWAPWFVKHNAIESELHGVKAENERLKKSMVHLIDVFKMIINMPVPATEKEYISWFVYVKNISGGAISDWEAEKYLQQFKDGVKEVESAKVIEYMPIHPDDARKFDCPTQFPMHLLSEGQAQRNHGQTLKRLKERGGLSVREILAIVGNKGWSYYGGLKWPEAIKMLNDILINQIK